MAVFKQSVLQLILWTVITGVAYPLVVTAISHFAFRSQSHGSLLRKNGLVIGSELIAQKFSKPQYFWPRPSAVNYNPLPSGGSNLGPTSADLKKAMDDRRAQGLNEGLLSASGSGLDPDISPTAAYSQQDRVARARRLSDEQKQKLKSLIASCVQPRSWGFLGEPRVNVLKLNLALDQEFQ